MKNIVQYLVIVLMVVSASCNTTPAKHNEQQPKNDLQTVQQLLQTITKPSYSLADVLADLGGYSFKPGFQVADIDTVVEFSRPQKSPGYISFNYKHGVNSISIDLPVADTITLQNLKQRFGDYYISPVAAKDPAYHFNYSNPSTKRNAILFLWSSHVSVIDKKVNDTSTIEPDNNLRVLDLKIQSVENK